MVTRLPKPRIETVDYTIGNLAICEIHHKQMKQIVVPIGYGLMMVDAKVEKRYAASTNSFPHAETIVFGGCVISENSPKNAVIFICPDCKKAAARWDEIYGKK